MKYTDLLYISKVKTNIAAFGNKVILIAQLLDISPNSLMFVMNNESGLDHTIKNPNGSATGLIQFTEATAKNLGTTTAALKAMTNVQQLDYVWKYLQQWKSEIKDTGSLYLSIFYPAALFKENSYQFPKWVVQANPIFDLNKDGNLTKSEFLSYVNQKYAKAIQANQITESAAQSKKSPLTDMFLLGIALYGLYKYQEYRNNN